MGQSREALENSARAAGVDWDRYGPLIRDRIVTDVLKKAPRKYGGLGQTRFGPR